MIFPGHVAAAVLIHRKFAVDKWVVLAASLAPDVVDKLLYYGLHVTPSSRVPMHTALALLLSGLLIAAIEWGVRRGGTWRWTTAWVLGYAAHLACDSPLTGGRLPILFPFRSYNFHSPDQPLGFVRGLTAPPWHTLIVEALLVMFTVYYEWRWRRSVSLKQAGEVA
jgi:hypothetical protein